jgi:ABC-type transport system involved in cytochrome bd biosynthesis fused ATPase/permease subunit
MAVLRTLLSSVSVGSRARIAVLAVLGLGARVSVVATALAIAHGHAKVAAIVGAVVTVLYGLQRVLQAQLRVRVECELYGSAARAIVDADVLDVPAGDPAHVLFGGSGQARTLLVDVVPALGADLVTCLLMVPLVAGEVPVRAVLIALVGLAVALVIVVAVRRAAERLQALSLERYQAVVDALLVAIEGRVELVARGGEEEYAAALERALSSYARVAERAAFGLALLGRAPLVFAAGAVAAAVAVDGAFREVLVAALLGRALVLAAILPAFVGLVGGVYEVVRSATPSRELVALLSLPPRKEKRGGGERAAVPAPIDVAGASFAYAPGASPSLRDVSLSWKPGRSLVLAGPNGSGKTTLLRLLIGLRAPTAGTISVGGKDLQGLDMGALRRAVAFLPQRPYLGEPYATVRYALRLACPSAADEAMVRALDRVGLLEGLGGRAENLLDVRVGALSAGQRQRLALARVLLQGAELVLLDEPDANLDQQGVRLVSSLVDELVAGGKMVAVAAHSAALSGERVELSKPDVD